MSATIFALASGRPPAGVAVIRLSGAGAWAAATDLGARIDQPGQMRLTLLRDPGNGRDLDRALVVAFRAPASFTGEDVVELHVHGGQAVIAAVLDSLAAMPGLRHAEPGEFTRRAFDSGRMDLVQVEALADLIAAETQAQHRQALAGIEGELGRRVTIWRQLLVGFLANLEAVLDFSDEDDVQVDQNDDALHALIAEWDELLTQGQMGERVRQGLTIVIAGPPNVGKSTLINALARRDVAIISDIPGTTRDSIEVPFDIAGVPVVLIDTAGLRESADPVEMEGVRRARARAQTADLLLHVACASADGTLSPEFSDLFSEMYSDMMDGPDMKDGAGERQFLMNKIDLSGTSPGLHDGVIHISAHTGLGMSFLREWLQAWVKRALPLALEPTLEPALVTRLRQREALGRARDSLAESLALASPLLRAEGVRATLRALERLIGHVGVEDVLDDIFGRFCIGK